MELFEAISTRQSSRNFLDGNIEKEILEKIIEAGINAPSPLNSQPWDWEASGIPCLIKNPLKRF